MDKDFDFERFYVKENERCGLPDFKRLAEDFDVEKLTEKEPMFLVREVRRVMNEKFSAYLHLFETLINPASQPMFVFSVLRRINEEDRETAKRIYKTLSKIQLLSMKLDTVYHEKLEIDFVNKTFVQWQKLKNEIHALLEKFEENFDKEDSTKERGYFG